MPLEVFCGAKQAYTNRIQLTVRPRPRWRSLQLRHGGQNEEGETRHLGWSTFTTVKIHSLVTKTYAVAVCRKHMRLHPFDWHAGSSYLV